MDDLIKRLQDATEGSRALDKGIARQIGMSCDTDGRWFHDRKRVNRLPHYTASLDAAILLVPEGWRTSEVGEYSGGYGQEKYWLWRLSSYERQASRAGRAPTPALALCIASLKAREIG